MTLLLEVVALNAEDAQRASDGGADRIEVCGDMSADGVTPSFRAVEEILRLNLPLDVMAMVRPREGDFLYTPAELEAMERTLLQFREMGVAGVVFGCLTSERRVDAVAVKRLVALAQPLSVTFHRAFDSVVDRAAALDALVCAGVDRVLTLGYPCGSPRLRTPVERVEETVRLAGGRLRVMTGGWLEKRDVDVLVAKGVREFHLGRAVRGSKGYASPVDAGRVREWKAYLRALSDGAGEPLRPAG